MNNTTPLPVLHVTPLPPVRSGIADYSVSFEQAMNEHTRWKIEPARVERVRGNSLRDWRLCKSRVEGWLRDGALERISLVHAEVGYQQHDEFYTLYWLRRLAPRVPYVITVHDPPLVTAPALYYLCLGSEAVRVRHFTRLLDYTPMGRGRVTRIIDAAAAVVTLSAKGAASLARLHRTRNVHVAPHLLLTDPPGCLDRECEKPVVTVLFMGFWGPYKGLETLIRAMEIVHEALPDRVRLLLTGGATTSPAAQRYVDGVVALVRSSHIGGITDMPGYLPEEKIQSTLDAADIFVLPYLHGIGSSASGPLLRAMASGLPIVASDVGAFSEEIDDGSNGRLVSPGDPIALAKAIKALVEDGAKRSRFGAEARASVLRRHDRRIVAEQFAGIYAEAMQRRRS